MNYKYYLGLILVFVSSLTLTDLQSQSQKEVKIGKQIWMTKNLDVSTFRNGDTIFEAKSKEDWVKAGESKRPAYCYYEYDTNNGKLYGKLYNWYAVVDIRGIAPKGYHIPTDDEWTELTGFLGGKENASEKLKNIEGWKKGAIGNNNSGFSAGPGGRCLFKGTFESILTFGNWWTSTESDEEMAWGRSMNHYNNSVYRNDYYKSNGLSIRCLKD